MKVVVAAFNQEKALVGAFSVITNLRMELFEALVTTPRLVSTQLRAGDSSQNKINDSWNLRSDRGLERRLEIAGRSDKI